MRLTSGSIAVIGAVLVLAGCRDDGGPLRPQRPQLDAQSQMPPCIALWECSGTTDGTIHDASGIGVLVEPAGDPSPGAPGIWLGRYVSPPLCYRLHNDGMVDTRDQDHDWLDDVCEYNIAQAFAPVLAISPTDNCSKGEPYWAAKYFPTASQDPNSIGEKEVVRVMYMPAYYADCGTHDVPVFYTDSHNGDSEFFSIDVWYNPSSQHWQVEQAFLSAHFEAPGESSEDVPATDLEFPTRPLAYPKIWVAQHKHGNYKSQYACARGGAFNLDTCADNQPMGRIRVYRDRNVGSRHHDEFPAGVPSQNPVLQRPGYPEAREFFYTQRKFRGWNYSADGVTPYREILWDRPFEFESRLPSASIWHPVGPGPGPANPAFTTPFGVIEGPSSVSYFSTPVWSSFVNGGTRPFQAEWKVRYNSWSDWISFFSTSGSDPLSAGTFAFFQGRCEPFTITLKVRSADGRTFQEASRSVVVTDCLPPISVSITGPDAVRPYSSCMYSATNLTGSEPFTFAWTADGVPVGDGSGAYRHSAGTGAFQLAVTVTDGQGRVASGLFTVNVSDYAPDCNDY